MHNQQILWSSLLTVMGMLAAAPAMANTIHDPGGTNPAQPSSLSIDNLNGNGISTNLIYDPDTGIISGEAIQNPVEIIDINSSAGGFGSGAEGRIGSSSAGGFGSGAEGRIGSNNETGLGNVNGSESNATGEGNIATGENSNSGESNSSLGKGECTSSDCLSTEGESQKLTLNDAAEILEDNLDASLKQLAEAETTRNEAVASGMERKPVRIYRRSAQACPSPDFSTIEARKAELHQIEVVQKQLAESQKFIEQVNIIDPEANIW
ncbi:MAG: hypothetical protein AAGE96_00055 [Cyanobacteria bacterium P01_G01_bin.19]